jgi:hypothetical protein
MSIPRHQWSRHKESNYLLCAHYTWTVVVWCPAEIGTITRPGRLSRSTEEYGQNMHNGVYPGREVKSCTMISLRKIGLENLKQNRKEKKKWMNRYISTYDQSEILFHHHRCAFNGFVLIRAMWQRTPDSVYESISKTIPLAQETHPSLGISCRSYISASHLYQSMSAVNLYGLFRR